MGAGRSTEGGECRGAVLIQMVRGGFRHWAELWAMAHPGSLTSSPGRADQGAGFPVSWTYTPLLAGKQAFFWEGGRLKGDAGVGGSRLVCDECANFRAPGLSRGQLLPWALQGLSAGLAQAQLWGRTRTATCPQGGACGLSGRGEGLRVTFVTHHWYIPGGAGQTRPGLPWAAGTGEALESSDTSQDGKEEILPIPTSCLLDYFGAWRERDIILQS